MNFIGFHSTDILRIKREKAVASLLSKSLNFRPKITVPVSFMGAVEMVCITYFCGMNIISLTVTNVKFDFSPIAEKLTYACTVYQ